jgi:short-subunit dehydrogenase
MIASRSTEKLQSVSSEIKTISQNTKVEIVPIDLAKNNYEAITSNSEVMNNLAIVVNNAGQLDPSKFLDQNPEKI